VLFKSTTMDVGDIVWVLVFGLLLMVLHLINFLIVSSLKGKSLGSQSIVDLVALDTFVILKCYGTITCLMCIFGRFASIQTVLTNSRFLLTIGCSIYMCGLICLSVNAGCVCIIRTLCICNMTFISETISECRVKQISVLMTFFCGLLVSLICIMNEDIESGTPLVLLTNKLKHPGEFLFTLFSK
jgi:hypothetical protein